MKLEADRDFLKLVGENEPSLLGEPVNLVDVIENGIPPRPWVRGCDGWLAAGKRYLIPAPAGTGKSLVMLTVCVHIVALGGAVTILDVENGSDEYARRLECILHANDQDGSLAAACADRLRYYEWPKLRLDWAPEEWADAVAGDDLVVFDSSRWILSAAGLDENSSNDYAEFANALLLPLSQAGITTVVLDNTGHGEEERGRGTKAKDDLNEVVYSLAKTGRCDESTTAVFRLKLTRQRFGGLHSRLEMRVGGGVYDMPGPVETPVDDDGNFRPTIYMRRVWDYVRDNPGCGSREIREAVSGRADLVNRGLAQLVKERYVEARATGEGRKTGHHTLREFDE